MIILLLDLYLIIFPGGGRLSLVLGGGAVAAWS